MITTETAERPNIPAVHLLRADDVCRMLAITRQTLYRWNRLRKGPPCIKVGRNRLYPNDRLAAWLESLEQTSGA